MKRTVFILSITIVGSLTMFFCYVFLKRLNLPYNNEGNYFDENDLITYKIQSVTVYGTLTLISLLVLGIILYRYFLMKRFVRHNR